MKVEVMQHEHADSKSLHYIVPTVNQENALIMQIVSSQYPTLL